MAYLISIVHLCQARGCGRKATHELFNHLNASMGYYCERDGQLQKKRLEAGKE